ncbi:hypothetical protein CFIMG_004398RA [Ceratocystis fimbriata CBS 114723]|uniref:D-isomer specific 2-hydroxyacid dehydrogenase NAD-binding domain-containing protein n=1 Tax=Ceratocystis fimbriata CBS 114723 TaxID=1035309 RepID=A0A2C5WTH2_9PEZI|nr:hypothetical protein CFIMG_004398RA [Ceratocystis fimbriata CBS 114723]
MPTFTSIPSPNNAMTISPLSNDILLLLIPTSLPAGWVENLQAKYPGFEVRFECTQNADLTLRPMSDVPIHKWDGVTMLVTYTPPPPELVPNVRYVQLLCVGSDEWRGHPLYENKNVLFCNASGVQPAQIAEWVIGSLLSAQRRFPRYQAYMKDGYWERNFDIDVDDCYGYRIGILGYGAIGRQVARLSQALGMEVYAFTHRERTTPESRKDATWSQPGQGDPAGLIPTRWFHGSTKDAINNFLGQDLDVLVVSLPLTDKTRKLLSHEQFDILARRHAFVSNVSRGGIVDQDALIEALETNKIRGAALDVTEPEPLPKNHPLWTTKNIFISPHVSWKSRKYWSRVLELTVMNLDAHAKGKKLFNQVSR